ncbi:arginyl-tRNA--protein arginylyltransferase [uncultured Cytophaga sp.]|uniref:arginyl-tRNA--protein arginylyltransferase n=1 Tax=uncultured Cytophaga sp. TaxID=160238 RepID=UPI0026248D75|nr:arginyl-tRNA--protein arginylyltransferase [uncultured Cytophaga sp.]
MFANVHNPETLTGEELDRYLSDGWFRNAQRIFTTNFLSFNKTFYSAIWLRIQLDQLVENDTFKKLSHINKNFKITIQEASITDEKEALYESYKQGISFSASQSLHALLLGDSSRRIYNTYEVLLHDGDVLIGVGYFDVGDRTAAGIVSFYNQAYKKNSLGKYLILLKVNYCKKKQLDYFYPGYFAPNYPAFEYKRSIGKEGLQYLQLATSKWIPMNQYVHSDDIYSVMHAKLLEALTTLQDNNIQASLLHYTFFEANIIPNLAGHHLFDFPVYISCFSIIEGVINPMIVFNIQTNCYHIIECMSVWKADESEQEVGFYAEHLLKLKRVVYSCAHADTLVEKVARIYLKNPQID